jgi:hypothetical protein
MTVETNPNYWDCECETTLYMLRLKPWHVLYVRMTEDESPDSRVNEIKENEDVR